MGKLRSSAEALIAAVILNALVFVLGTARVAWAPTIAGLSVLIVLLAFDKGQARSFAQSVAYAASCGFLLATAALFPMLQYLHDFTAPIDALTGRPLLPALWLAASVAFLTADRVRNTTTPITVQLRSPEPVISVQAPAPAPAAPSAPMPIAPAVRSAPPVPVPTAPAPAVAVNAPPVPEPVPVIPIAPTPPAIPENAIEVKAQPAPPGKPAVIYVNLLDSGIACLRPIQAERLSKDFYRIVEPMPEGEEWEFKTGQIVRCRKQSLSSGKGLVAFEEAPRVN
jgi:hypothetical protein